MAINKKNFQTIISSFVLILLLLNVILQNRINDSNYALHQGNAEKRLPSNEGKTAILNKNKYTFTEKYQLDESLGAMNDIMLQDNLAFVAVQWGGLAIFDITNLAHPLLLGSYNEPQETTSGYKLTSGIFVREKIAFVADGANGLLILNVTNPLNPEKIGQYIEESGSYFRVFVVDNLAYVLAEYRDHIIIFDVSDLTTPIKLGEKTFAGGYNELLVKNDLIFLGDYSGSSIIINASNPNNLIEIATLNNTRVCAIKQEYLVTVMESKRVIIYNLATIPTLTVLANYSLAINGAVKYLTINDKFAFIGSTEEIVMINLTDTLNPQTISKVSNLNWFYDMDSIWVRRKLTTPNDPTKRDILFFTDYQKGLFIYNFSKTMEEPLIGYYNCGMKAELVAAKDDYVYVVSMVENPYYPSQFEIYTLNENSLKRVSTYPINGSTWDLTLIDDGIVLLALVNGIDVVNVTDPTNPTRLSFYYYSSGPFPNWNLVYEEQQAIIYLCADDDGLVIIDASDLQNLTFITRVNNFFGYYYRAKDVFIYENIAFVADVNMFGGFGMIDVSNPRNPFIIDYIPLNDAINGIHVENDLAYLTAVDSPGLQIFNVSDIHNPTKLSECLEKEGSTGRFSFNDSLCFLAQWDRGLTLIDIRNPAEPIVITSISDSLTGGCKGVFVNGSNIFLADAWDGLEVWELTITPLPHSMNKVQLYTILSALSLATTFALILTVFKRRKNRS